MSTKKVLPGSTKPFAPPLDQDIVPAPLNVRAPLSDEKVDLIIAVLREQQNGIEGYALAPLGRRRKVAPAATLSDAALEAVAQGCETSERLAVASDLSGAEVRGTVQRSVAAAASSASCWCSRAAWTTP